MIRDEPEQPDRELASSRPSEPIGAPQIAIDLPPSADGASFAAWQDHLSYAGRAELVDANDLTAFHTSVRVVTIKPFLFSETFVSHPVRLRRSAEDVARTGLDLVILSLHVAGRYRWNFAGGSRIAETGDISIVDFGEPYDLEMSAIRTLAVAVPRAILPEALGARPLAGLVLPASRAAPRLLASTLRTLFGELTRMTPDEAASAGHAILAMTTAAAQGGPGQGLQDTTARPARLSLFERAQVAIEERLADPALSVETVAQALAVSRSALYRPFTPYGGIQSYILERRLQRGYERIAHGIDPDNSLRALAGSLGFVSEAHFSRVFKQRFGLGPRALRAVARNRSVFLVPPRVPSLPPDTIRTLGE